jgi:hypothetical protein
MSDYDNGPDESTTPRRPVTIRWSARRSSSPGSRDLEARLTVTLAGGLWWRACSWLFPARGDD